MDRSMSVGERGRFGRKHVPSDDDAAPEATSRPSGVRVVVRNTFLELFPENAPEKCSDDASDSTDVGSMEDTRSALTASSDVASVADGDSDSEVKERWSEDPMDELDTRTSVVLKNLPFVCPNTMIIELLDRHGLRGRYDFLYAPTNFKVWESYGYCFVNLVDNESARVAMSVLAGYDGWATELRKPLEVCWCESHQGLSAHVERFRDSPVMHHSVDEPWKPLIFAGGRQCPFPRPTKRIKAPKCRHGQHFDRARNEEDHLPSPARPLPLSLPEI